MRNYVIFRKNRSSKDMSSQIHEKYAHNLGHDAQFAG